MTPGEGAAGEDTLGNVSKDDLARHSSHVLFLRADGQHAHAAAENDEALGSKRPLKCPFIPGEPMPQRGKYLPLDPGNRLEPVVSEAHRRGPDTDRGHLFDKRARRGAGRGIMSDYEQHVCRVID